MAQLLGCVLLVLSFLPASEAFGSGAPARACTNLQPIHTGVVGQTSPSPYNFSVSSMYYTPGTPLTVTITGTFGGFLLQARAQGSPNSVGTFTSSGATTQLRQCRVAGDSITHTSPAEKTNLQLTWNPPSSDMGTIVFMGSVAQNRATWWGTLSSEPVMFRSGAGAAQVSLLTTTLAVLLGLATRLF